jgi:HEAT repeat protein
MAILLSGCSGPTPDPNAARIERYRQEGNAGALAQEVETGDPTVGRAAVRAMGFMGKKALPQIEQALKDKRPEIREEAALAYGRAADQQEVRQLATVARVDPAPVVRAAAVTALGDARALDEMETLLAAADDPDRAVRVRAGAAITRIFGRRYELYIDGPPEERQRAIAALRVDWVAEQRGTRDYYKIQRQQHRIR